MEAVEGVLGPTPGVSWGVPCWGCCEAVLKDRSPGLPPRGTAPPPPLLLGPRGGWGEGALPAVMLRLPAGVLRGGNKAGGSQRHLRSEQAGMAPSPVHAGGGARGSIRAAARRRCLLLLRRRRRRRAAPGGWEQHRGNRGSWRRL